MPVAFFGGSGAICTCLPAGLRIDCYVSSSPRSPAASASAVARTRRRRADGLLPRLHARGARSPDRTVAPPPPRVFRPTDRSGAPPAASSALDSDVVRAAPRIHKGTSMLANRRGAAERSARHGLLLAVAAATLWGTVGVASKMLPDGAILSSFDLALARLAIAAPLLVLFSGLFLGRALWANAAHAWPWIAAVGVLAACYQFCLFVSLEQLGVARTALLTVCLPPALIAAASALVHHQRPSARTTGALLMALGSLMLVTGGSKGHDAVPGAAPLLGLAAGDPCGAGVRLALRPRPNAGKTHSPPAGRQLRLRSRCRSAGRDRPCEWSRRAWGNLRGSDDAATHLGSRLSRHLPTALAYICYFYGMQLSRTATSGVAATLVEPAVAVLLAAGLLGEHLSPTVWLGVACLLFATILLGLEGRRSRQQSLPHPMPPSDPTRGSLPQRSSRTDRRYVVSSGPSRTCRCGPSSAASCPSSSPTSPGSPSCLRSRPSASGCRPACSDHTPNNR